MPEQSYRPTLTPTPAATAPMQPMPSHGYDEDWAGLAATNPALARWGREEPSVLESALERAARRIYRFLGGGGDVGAGTVQGENFLLPGTTNKLAGALEPGIASELRNSVSGALESLLKRVRTKSVTSKLGKAVQDALREDFPGVELHLFDRSNDYSGKVWYLDTINMPPEKRNQGTGTQVLERLATLADEHGATLALSPSSDFGSSVPRLREFYKRFGFQRNAGARADNAITGAMIRRPVAAKAGQIGAQIPEPIRAYHGSPHDFDQFSLDKIGTGEGAQAYGHGLYFAENEGVARDYQQRLAGQSDQARYKWRGQEYQGRSGPEAHALSLAYYDSPATARRIGAEGLAAAERGEPWAVEQGGVEYWSKMKATADQVKRKQEIALAKGRMYEVEIDAAPDELLDWDKPLSQQSEKVKAALAALGVSRPVPTAVEASTALQRIKRSGASLSSALNRDVNEGIDLAEAAIRTGQRDPYVQWFNTKGRDILAQYGDEPLGRELYHATAKQHGTPSPVLPTIQLPNPAAASEALRAHGVAGIQYLDAGSRSAGASEQTRNLVLFDDKLITILRKYGIAGAVGAGYTMQQIEAAQKQVGGQ